MFSGFKYKIELNISVFTFAEGLCAGQYQNEKPEV